MRARKNAHKLIYENACLRRPEVVASARFAHGIRQKIEPFATTLFEKKLSLIFAKSQPAIYFVFAVHSSAVGAVVATYATAFQTAEHR